MHFNNWENIYLLWLVVLLGIFMFWRLRKKQELREKFVEKKLLHEIANNIDLKKEIRQVVFILIAGIFSIIALMRPQWGFEWQEVKRQGVDVMIALDTSKSMLTQDVKPSRFERSKLAIRDLVKQLKGDRIGLIAFSGSSFLACPLTVDYNGFLMVLDDTDTKTISTGGTDLSLAVKEAIKGYKKSSSKNKALIIITDGEDLEGNVDEALKEAKEAGISIHCVGVGTKEGELIQVKDENGNNEFLKDKNGNFVKSRLNEDLLEKITLQSDGIYVRSSGAEFGLDVIYEKRLSKIEKQEVESKMEKRYFDRFQIPLAIAFLFLLWETLIGLRRK